MTFRLLLGTQNPGKLREYQQIFDGLPLALLTLDDVGLGGLDVEETGSTFTENATLKAVAYAKAAGMWALADDSGLCVDALDGAPGVYSARYAGVGASNADRRGKLLSALAGVPNDKRGAYFACVIALHNPADDTTHTVEGRCDGQIAHTESSGQYGFGYDPIFIPDGYDVSLADILPDEKHAISHRGNAARSLRPILAQLSAGA